MAAADILMKPEECVMLLVDFQAGDKLSELIGTIRGQS
jgi:hypothetical protein